MPSFYSIAFAEPCLSLEDVEKFLSLSEFIVQDRTKKGKIRKTDIRKAVEEFSFSDANTIEITLK